VKAFSQKKDHALVVVGDYKTPNHWQCSGTTFLSLEAQSSLGFDLEKFLPYNHYCRKMLGYLYAIEHNATVIVDTDDDNIPYDDWSFPSFDGEYEAVEPDLGFVNMYSLFTKQKIWPRGLPLHLISQGSKLTTSQAQTASIGVWQGLADGDPDVDAIYRLTSDESCQFASRPPVYLGHRTLCPFNSQNTSFRRELFPLLYLPTTVTFRFTDILRATVAQPIMWQHGFNLGFTKATVRQERNPHDYVKDFESEIPMYLTNEIAASAVASSIGRTDSISMQLLSAYKTLAELKIVNDSEVATVQAWLSDLKRLGFS
jgi:hypothetical protein